jgi:hypothetical protein
MTGPEHYREAERRLRGTRASGGQDRPTTYSPTPDDIAVAQVHATLALAAATALYSDDHPHRQWLQAAGTEPTP